MNLPVIFSKLAGLAKSACGSGLLIVKKHAPEIMIGTGIAGFGLTVYETVKATNKTNDILEEKETREAQYRDFFTEEKDLAHECKALARRTRFRLLKTWMPVATTGAGSVIFILGGYRILNGRLVATAAAYKMLEAQFDRYRENAIEQYGEEADWNLANGIKAERIDAAKAEAAENRQIIEANKDKKLRKAKPKTAYHELSSRLLDPHSDHWQRYWTPDLFLEWVKQKQREANDKLILNGHLFENELNDAFGIPRTPEGQVLGWIRDKEHPYSKVSVGIDEMPEEELRRILSTHRNEDLYMWLHYNSMGIIYDMI